MSRSSSGANHAQWLFVVEYRSSCTVFFFSFSLYEYLCVCVCVCLYMFACIWRNEQYCNNNCLNLASLTFYSKIWKLTTRKVLIVVLSWLHIWNAHLVAKSTFGTIQLFVLTIIEKHFEMRNIRNFFQFYFYISPLNAIQVLFTDSSIISFHVFAYQNAFT